MWLSTLLFAWLCATLVSACMFPFNNPEFTNSSLLEEYIAEQQAKGGNGWLTTIGPGTVSPSAWPRNNPAGTLTSIYYCFESHAAFVALKNIVEEANNLWRNKIGRSSDNQHSFDGFKHYYSKNTNSHPRCYKQFPDQGWNPEVPQGTLVIKHNLQDWSDSTTGYLDQSLGIYPNPDRHQLRIEKSGGLHLGWLLVVAHELGHVLGLTHEHQRLDRDAYVKFDCTKLSNYAQAKAKVDANPQWGFSMEDVCASNNLGRTHGLDFVEPFDFSQDMGARRPHYHSHHFDFSSIMLYPSISYAENPNGGVRDLPLVRWTNGRPLDGRVTDTNAVIIPHALGISNGDKAGIQYLYPPA